MNIGLFTDTYFPQISGVSTSVSILAYELRKLGNNVYIFTTTDPKVKRSQYNKGKEKYIYRFSSFPYPFYGARNRRIAFRGYFEAIKIAKMLSLDIVHTQTEFSIGLIGKIVAHQLNVPQIHTYHTMYQDYTQNIMSGHLIKANGVKRIARLFLGSVNGIVAPSKRVYDTLRGYGIKCSMPIIPTGIPFLKKNSKNSVLKLRRSLNIKEKQPVILYLGRISREKSIDQLIKMIPYIIKDYSNVILTIVGDGPERKNLEKYVTDLGIKNNIRFVGMVDHSKIYSYYKLANVFVSTSTSESQGLTFLESINANTPFVAINNSFVSKIAENRFIGKTVVRSNQMIPYIEGYLKNSFYKKENKSRKKILEINSSENFGKRIFNFYKRILDEFNKDDLGYLPYNSGHIDNRTDIFK